MTRKQEALEAVWRKIRNMLNKINPRSNQDYQDLAGVALKTYLSTIWRPFDPDDPADADEIEATASSGKPWLVRDKFGFLHNAEWCGDQMWHIVQDGGGLGGPVYQAVAYLDPADLMPGE